MHFSIADYLLDIVQNGFEAEATELTVTVTEADKTVELVVSDNGCGMSDEVQARAIDPFYTAPGKHSARKAGLGLPFLIQAAESCGGAFALQSEEGVGTEVSCSFRRDNIDTPPMGNLISAVVAMMTMDGEYDLTFYRTLDDTQYEVSRKDLKDALGELETSGSIALLKTFVTSLEEN